jgi:hypothetical protein
MADIDYSKLPQGDVRLIGDPIAQRMLASDELARLAYVFRDGTPRVIPMGFVWNGSAIVFATFAKTAKLASLRARPDVAITVDRAGPPPDVLLIRGRAAIEEVDGFVEEYGQIQRKYYGAELADATVTRVRQAGAAMARIVVEPTWVSTLDYQNRVPGALVNAGLAG